MRYIKDILNKWWNVRGSQGAYFPYTFPAIRGNNTVIFQGSPCTIRVAIEHSGAVQRSYHVKTSTGVPEQIIFTRRPSPASSLVAEVSRMAGKVQYLEINGTVIFDNR